MNRNDMYYADSAAQNEVAAQAMPEGVQYESLSGYMTKTFLWMFLGLLTTFVTAYSGYRSGAVLYVLSTPLLYLGLTILEFVVVIWLSARIQNMSVMLARTLFFAYAVLNGIVFGAYFYMFDISVMVLSFGAAALYFGIMAAYGALTKQDISGWGKMLMCGLLALIVFSVLQMFLGFQLLDILLSGIGVALFLGLTAWDTQKMKNMYYAYSGDSEMAKKASIYSALSLYLDFVNLFLFLLRLFGRRARR